MEPLAQHRERRRDESTEAHHSFPQNRSPSPVHGGYASWLTDSFLSTRDEAARRPLPLPSDATSSSASRPANPPTSAPARRPDLPRQAEPSNTTSRNFTAAPNHSTNWLDPTEARRSARQPHIPQPFATLEPNSPSAASSSDTDTDYGIDIDEVLTEDEAAGMPATNHFAQRRQPRASVVDLTNDPSSPPRPTTSTRKRSRDDSGQDRRSAKRSRRASNSASPKGQPAVEELDLTNEAPSAEEELLQNQQQAAIAAQQSAADPDRPLRVGQRTCIICMEPYTNATVTACGHIYCHECLTQALIAGEKNSERGVGNCPVCRKPVNRKKERQMVPVSFMTREAWKGKRPARSVGVGG